MYVSPRGDLHPPSGLAFEVPPSPPLDLLLQDFLVIGFRTPAGQAALRLALEVSQAQGEGPHSEEVRRALWDHAPGPVDLLLLEPSALDREVLVPRLILGP